MAILVSQNIYLTTIIYMFHLAICTQWFQYKPSITFSGIFRNAPIYSLYSRPTELFPSPTGSNPLNAGYLSFQYNAPTECLTSGYLTAVTHACTQLIRKNFL